MTVSFRLHSELNVFLDTVQVVKELGQLLWIMWPDDEPVIHVAKSTEGLVGRPSRAISSKCSMMKFAMIEESGEPTATSSVCS
jgi:hypothetical protein